MVVSAFPAQCPQAVRDKVVALAKDDASLPGIQKALEALGASSERQ